MKRRMRMAAALFGLLMLCGCAQRGQEPQVSASVQPEQSGEERVQTIPLLQTTQATPVGYEYQYANMQLELPEGWEWSLAEYTPDCCRFGISFWPEAAESGKVELFYYSGGFGVCGTGLKQEEIRFESGLSAVMGTYDNGAVWDYISFSGTPGPYVAQTDGVESWWHEYGQEVMAILGSAKLGQGNLTEEEALQLARQSCGAEYAREYASFDFESGQWKVQFWNSSRESAWEVLIDSQGKEVETLCGLPKAPQEEGL